jgi:hypothetical protein
LLNKWRKAINVSCLSPLIELTNHMRSHSVWLSTAPKLETCVTCPRSISKNQTLSAWNLLCLCHVCDEEKLQLIFLEDTGTLEYYACILLLRLCAVQFENILCTCVWCTGTSRVTYTHNILHNPMENGFCWRCEWIFV